MRLLCKCLAVVLILASVCCSPVFAAPPRGDNLARGARYTFTPEANYSLTRDPSDRTKLTDGHYALGRFWTDRLATVGWQDSGPIRIKIYLGMNVAIDAICVTTARGKEAGVSYPERIDIFSTDGGGQYQYMGDLLTGKDTDDGEYQVRRFCSEPLQITGNAVMLVLKPHGHYAFLDEVEILGQRTNAPPGGFAQQGLKDDGIGSYLKERYRIMTDRKALLGLIKELKNSPPGLAANCQALASSSARLTQVGDQLDRNELNVLEKQLFACRQPWLAEHYREPLLVWIPNPWELFTPLSLPTSPKSYANRKIEIDLPSSGTSSAALGIANTTARPITVQVIHDSKRTGPNVTVREVSSVVRQDYRTIGDPLVTLPGGILTILPGQSKQLWVTMRAGPAPAGIYADIIRITGPSIAITIPLSLKIYEVSLSGNTSLSVNAWSYLNWRQIRHIPEKAADDLEAHHVNVMVVHPDQIPWPRYSALTAYSSPNFHPFDRVLKLSRGVHKFLFYLGLNDPVRRNLIAPYPFLSEEWRTGFIRWISEWLEHLRKCGFKEENFAWYPFDEPRTEQEFLAIIEIDKMLKRIHPQLQTYSTLCALPDKEAGAFFDHLDLVQVLEPLIPKVKKLIGSRRKTQIWSYTANGGGKGADPQSFYRLQAWRAFKHDATGIGFWAYADTGSSGTAWDDFDGNRPDYSVIYEGDNSIVSSKRWEAWREGVEDYELLLQAKKKVKPGQEKEEFERRVAGVLERPNDYPYFLETRRFLLAIASR